MGSGVCVGAGVVDGGTGVMDGWTVALGAAQPASRKRRMIRASLIIVMFLFEINPDYNWKVV
jgi:hypothetical protein